MTNFLTVDQMKTKAPSIFTRGSYEKTGADYAHISTFDVMSGLFDMGFGVTSVKEVRVRKEEKRGFSKHLVRLRRHNEEMIDGNYPEIVLINSHDGSTSYQMRAGIYRMVCTNGLVVGNELYKQKVRHEGDVVTRVANAGSEIIEVFPTIIDKAITWKNIELSDNMRIAFADASKLLRWDTETVEVESKDILTPWRREDTKQDLWTTYNVVQENIIKGGVFEKNKETGKRRRSRAVNAPIENTKLNSALWLLSERMASLAG